MDGKVMVELDEREARALALLANERCAMWREVLASDPALREFLDKALEGEGVSVAPLESAAMRLETAMMAEGLSE